VLFQKMSPYIKKLEKKKLYFSSAKNVKYIYNIDHILIISNCIYYLYLQEKFLPIHFITEFDDMLEDDTTTVLQP